MQTKPTTIRFVPEDLELLGALQQRTGIQSVSDAVRFALRQAELGPQAAAIQPRDLESKAQADLRAALDFWKPTGFSEVRAKAAAEEALLALGAAR